MTPDKLINIACSHFGITRSRLMKRAINHNTRHFIMWLLRTICHLSYTKIAASLGGYDHTSVMYAVERVNLLLTMNRFTPEEIALLSALKAAIHELQRYSPEGISF